MNEVYSSQAARIPGEGTQVLSLCGRSIKLIFLEEQVGQEIGSWSLSENATCRRLEGDSDAKEPKIWKNLLPIPPTAPIYDLHEGEAAEGAWSVVQAGLLPSFPE